MEIWTPWDTSRHAPELVAPVAPTQPIDDEFHAGGTWIGPLTCVRVVRRSRPHMSALPHVWEAVEAFLDCSPSCSLTQAAAFGSMRLLRGISARSGAMVTLDAFYKQAQFSGAMQHAAARGDVAMMQWLLTFQPGGLVTRAVEQAARNGQLQVLRWLKDNHDHVFWGANELRYAVEGNHLDVVRWLQEHTRPPTKLRAMNLAAANGNLELIQWLYQVRHEASSSAAAKAAKAAAGGHFEVLLFLHNKRSEGCTMDAAVNASRNEHVEILQWFFRFYPRMIHREKVIVFAKRYNYYLMDWLHRNYQASGERTVLAEINSSFYLTPPETEELTT
ncbi:hypothetical protein PRIC2_011285 [Phytophthora ramorum]